MSTHRDRDELPEDLKETREEIEQAKRMIRDDQPAKPMFGAQDDESDGSAGTAPSS